MVNQGRRFWKAEHPFNPTLIITGTELFSNQEPPYCWEGLGGLHARFANEHYLLRDLIQICDVTQQLYLDMKSRFDLLQEQWKKRQTKNTNKKIPRKGDPEATIGLTLMRRVPGDTKV